MKARFSLKFAEMAENEEKFHISASAHRQELIDPSFQPKSVYFSFQI